MVARFGRAVRLDRRRRHAAHLPLRRFRRRAARSDARTQLQLARDCRQRPGDRRPAPELHRAADAGQHHFAHRRSDQALRLQRRGGRRSHAGPRRKRHLQRRERRRRADVGRVSAELHARQEMAAVHAAARRPAQRRHRRHSVALERAGLRQLGLRHGVAQLPRLDRLRPGLDRFDHERVGRPAVPGHPQGGRVVPGPAVDRRGSHGRGRRQLRRLSRFDDSRPAASVQDAGRARRGVQQLHAVRERRRRDEETLRRILGRPGALQSQLAAPGSGELQDADAGDSRPARPPRADQSRHRAVQHAAEPRRAEQARVLPGREPLGAEAAELAVLVRDQAQVARTVRHARTRRRRESRSDRSHFRIEAERHESTRTDQDEHRRCNRPVVARRSASRRRSRRAC